MNCLLAEITAIEGRKLSLKPFGNMGGVLPPELHDVPLGRLGGKKNSIDISVDIGDVVICFFTTLDTSNYVSFGGKDTSLDVNKNSLNSCFCVPVCFDFSILNSEITKSISIVGDIEQKGTLKVSSDIKSDTEVSAGSVKLTQHKHGGVQGGSSETTKPI